MFFSLFRQRERTKRDHVARFRLDKISILRTVLRDSLRSNRSSHRLQRRTHSSYFIANLLAIAIPYTLRGGTPPPMLCRPIGLIITLHSTLYTLHGDLCAPPMLCRPCGTNHNSTLYTLHYFLRISVRPSRRGRITFSTRSSCAT